MAPHKFFNLFIKYLGYKHFLLHVSVTWVICLKNFYKYLGYKHGLFLLHVSVI